MISADSNWEELKSQWQQAEAPIRPDLHRLLRRRRNLTWLFTALDFLVSIGMIVAVLALWEDLPPAAAKFIAVLLGTLLVVCWSVTLKIRRGTWWIEAGTALEQIDHLIRRTKASMRLARFNQIGVLAGIIIGLVAGEFGPDIPSTIPPSWEAHREALRIGLFVLAGVVAVAVLWVAEWFYRRKKTELVSLEKMRQDAQIW